MIKQLIVILFSVLFVSCSLPLKQNKEITVKNIKAISVGSEEQFVNSKVSQSIIQQPTVTLAWECKELTNYNYMIFQIEGKPNLQTTNWNILATTTNLSITLPRTNNMQVYRISCSSWQIK